MSDLTTGSTTEDAVSRQAVLDLLQMKYFGKDLYMAIYNLPSAEKTGHWIYIDDDTLIYDSYNCSECHKSITVDIERKDDIGFVINDMKYCPNCGARMAESEE